MITLGFTSCNKNHCEKITCENSSPQNLANVFFRKTGEWPDLIVVADNDEIINRFKIDVDYQPIDI